MSTRFDRSALSDAPERLRRASGSALERRLLDAAAREQPSRELSERMALAIGVAAPPLIAPDSAAPDAALERLEPGAPNLGSSATMATSAAKTVLPWISVAAIVVAVGGGVIAARSGSAPTTPSRSGSQLSAPAPAPTSADVATPRPAIPETGLPPQKVVEAEAPPITSARSRAPVPAPDLQAQIALLDSARSALASGASARALELLRHYQGKYPAGSFRPEAAALRIEALSKLGRNTEARAQADRFLSEHAGSPLAERVQRVTANKRP